MNETDLMTERQKELCSLVWSSLPGPQPAPRTNEERWHRVVGPAMLVKATATAESMFRLLPERRMTDSLILLRALYEGVVNLAWVAVNPTHRLNRLYTEFHTWHLREDEDWAKAGRPLLTPDDVQESQAWIDTHKTGLPHMADRAKNADRYWAARLAGWHPDAAKMTDTRSWSSLRGLYRFIYTRGSQATHSHHRGLDPFVTVTDTVCTPHAEKEPDSLVVWELGIRVLPFGIGPAERTFGWPSYDRAMDIVAALTDG